MKVPFLINAAKKHGSCYIWSSLFSSWWLRFLFCSSTDIGKVYHISKQRKTKNRNQLSGLKGDPFTEIPRGIHLTIKIAPCSYSSGDKKYFLNFPQSKSSFYSSVLPKAWRYFGSYLSLLSEFCCSGLWAIVKYSLLCCPYHIPNVLLPVRQSRGMEFPSWNEMWTMDNWKEQRNIR